MRSERLDRSCRRAFRCADWSGTSPKTEAPTGSSATCSNGLTFPFSGPVRLPRMGRSLPLAREVWENDLAVWQTECASSRTAAMSRRLDDTGSRHGRPCSLRWVYVHAIEELHARHNGHADLLRELIDGDVGW